MPIFISGPGVGLPPPQNLYPSELNNSPDDFPTNFLALAAGEVAIIPAGQWVVDPGVYSIVQFLDPQTGIWRMFNTVRGQPQPVRSDGFTRRIANLTGCPISAIVTNGGSGFNASSATITASTGGSMWTPIVGGNLSVSTINAAGANYSVAPEVFIPTPPSPGIPATAYATIASGTVSGVTLTNTGAGYLTAPKAVILPHPADPNFGSITTASVTLVLVAANSAAITGALCTYNGTPLTTLTNLTLTAAGGSGTGATITPVIMQTIASATVTAGGGGWGNATTPPMITTAGGVPTSTSAIVNPALELTNFRPRAATINVTSSGAGALSAPVLTDPGLFAGTATPAFCPGGTLPTTLASITLVMGSAPDVVMIQPI